LDWPFGHCGKAKAGLAAAYVRAAHIYRNRLAARKGETIDVLSTVSSVSYEVLGLLGGGFFGILFAYLANTEYHKAGGFSGNTLLMAGLGVIGLDAFGVSLVKFLRYQRANKTISQVGGR